LPPPGKTLLDCLAEKHVPRVGVGKVDDLFAGRGISSVHTATNAEAYALIEGAFAAMRRGLLLANVIEFDQSWGHRNDVPGFHRGLQELDRSLPRLIGGVREEDLVIFTADHGNDPTTPSTDHSREVVPLLVVGPRVRAVALGRRSTFADIGQTVAEFLGVPALEAGTSFLSEVWSD
jgi:phosphopentomutase